MKRSMYPDCIRWFPRRALLLVGIGFAVVACGQPQGPANPTGEAVPAGSAGQSSIPTAPPPSLTRTPVPTVAATYAVTPEVPKPNPAGKPTPAQRPQLAPTPRPEDPFTSTSYPLHYPNTPSSTLNSTVVVIGTVKQVLPARWTTPDGRRPANPHDAATNRDLIYTPVLLDVEQYLKGQRPQRELLIFGGGGTVGRDSMTRSDGLDSFQEGQRVVLFLVEIGHEPRAFNGRPLWDIDERYTIIPDGLATNYYRTVPLQQLLDEIAAAQQRP